MPKRIGHDADDWHWTQAITYIAFDIQDPPRGTFWQLPEAIRPRTEGRRISGQDEIKVAEATRDLLTDLRSGVIAPKNITFPRYWISNEGALDETVDIAQERTFSQIVDLFRFQYGERLTQNPSFQWPSWDSVQAMVLSKSDVLRTWPQQEMTTSRNWREIETWVKEVFLVSLNPEEKVTKTKFAEELNKSFGIGRDDAKDNYYESLIPSPRRHGRRGRPRKGA